MSELFLIAEGVDGCYPDFYTTVVTTKEDVVETIRAMAKSEEYEFMFQAGVIGVTVDGNKIDIRYMDYLDEVQTTEWSLVEVKTIHNGRLQCTQNT